MSTKAPSGLSIYYYLIESIAVTGLLESRNFKNTLLYIQLARWNLSMHVE
jgi:hypothetical protein